VIFTCHLPRDKFCQKYLSDPAFIEKITPFTYLFKNSASFFYTFGMKLMNTITGEHQALPEEMLTKKTSIICSVNVVAGVKILQFPYPFVYQNLRNPSLFIYLMPEKGTLFGWSLPVEVIKESTLPPGGLKLGKIVN